MSCYREAFQVRTRGETQILDLTPRLREIVARSGIEEGVLHLFVPGSTAGLTTIEYEEGCLEDLAAAIERLAPRHGEYAHNLRWGDGNGYAHVRAALLGPSLSVPVGGGEPLLGTWQQVVLIDFDNRARDRRVLASVVG